MVPIAGIDSKKPVADQTSPRSKVPVAGIEKGKFYVVYSNERGNVKLGSSMPH